MDVETLHGYSADRQPIHTIRVCVTGKTGSVDSVMTPEEARTLGTAFLQAASLAAYGVET